MSISIYPTLVSYDTSLQYVIDVRLQLTPGFDVGRAVQHLCDSILYTATRRDVFFHEVMF